MPLIKFIKIAFGLRKKYFFLIIIFLFKTLINLKDENLY